MWMLTLPQHCSVQANVESMGVTQLPVSKELQPKKSPTHFAVNALDEPAMLTEISRSASSLVQIPETLS